MGTQLLAFLLLSHCRREHADIASLSQDCLLCLRRFVFVRHLGTYHKPSGMTHCRSHQKLSIDSSMPVCGVGLRVQQYGMIIGSWNSFSTAVYDVCGDAISVPCPK